MPHVVHYQTLELDKLISCPFVSTEFIKYSPVSDIIAAFCLFIVAVHGSLWRVLLKRLNLNPVDIIESNSEKIMNILSSNHNIPIISKYSSVGSAWNTCQESATHLALKTILSIHPSSIQPLLMKYAINTFKSSDVMNATKEDCEIMVTKSNQLYHPGLKKQYVMYILCSCVLK